MPAYPSRVIRVTLGTRCCACTCWHHIREAALQLPMPTPDGSGDLSLRIAEENASQTPSHWWKADESGRSGIGFEEMMACLIGCTDIVGQTMGDVDKCPGTFCALSRTIPTFDFYPIVKPNADRKCCKTCFASNRLMLWYCKRKEWMNIRWSFAHPLWFGTTK